MREHEPESSAIEHARRVWQQRLRIAELETALRDIRVQLDAVTRSRSWRMTEPGRTLLAWLRSSPHRDHTASVAPLPSAVPGPPSSESALFSPTARILFVDVTGLALGYSYGGIARVARAVLSELLFLPPRGWCVVPVLLSQDAGFIGASGRLSHSFGDIKDPWDGRRINIRPGDAFLGLDLNRDHADLLEPEIARFSDAGAAVSFVIYDLLPIDFPQYFPEGIPTRFEQWLRIVAKHAQTAACISAHVANRLQDWFEQASSQTRTRRVVTFPLGVDPVQSRRRPRCDLRPSLLMVGTVEPRKRYDVALDAMEALWSRGVDATLTIVGRQGWHAEKLVARIRRHPELGGRLSWYSSASDEEVQDQYARADCLLCCSIAEGYGLPLIEAAAHGLHRIVRDIPEFREVAGSAAIYFGSRNEGDPRAAIVEWLERDSSTKQAPPRSQSSPEPARWQQATSELMKRLDIGANEASFGGSTIEHL